MKILSSKAHGIIDYLFAFFLLASPTIFQMEGNLCTITYVSGAAHLAITLLTDFEMGAIKVIPFRIHGLIELPVAAALAAIAYWFNNMGNMFGFYLYAALAAVVIIVFLITDFTGPTADE